jgi:glutamate-1-semialdehyde 2,1-aminomutase
MLALRAARAATGRDLVGRFEQSYHGTHDQVSNDRRGIPAVVGDQAIELPWADADGVERVLAGREREVAAIIIEPIQGAGGVRSAPPTFLRFLRSYTETHGMLLVFDEIISFRVGPGGVQGRSGVQPDLTTLGKIIGGGYPLAGFGGRADVMAAFDARRSDALQHGGTFNGNPVAAAAGLATLRALTPDVYEELATRGERLAGRLRDGIARSGLSATVAQDASLFDIRSDAAQAELFLGLLLEGYWIASRGMGALSTPMTDADVDGFADAAIEVLEAAREA